MNFSDRKNQKIGMSALHGRVTIVFFLRKRLNSNWRVVVLATRERVSKARKKERCDKQQEGQRVKEDIS